MEGSAEHDGFVKMRTAMKAVDPTISVGAVGHESSRDRKWARDVLTRGGDVMDYYVIHAYPQYYNYGNPRREIADILAIPQRLWPKIKTEADIAFDQFAKGRQIPIALNEFNIVPEWGKEDYRNYMNKQVNALFIADSIGQMVANGYAMVAQWDVMNGSSPELSGRETNEFGLMFAYERDPQMTRQPKYYVFPIWARFGSAMLPVESSADPARELSIYAGRVDAGTISVLVINKSDRPADVQIALAGVKQITGGLIDTLTAESADSTTAAFNGVSNPRDDLSDAPPGALQGSVNNRLSYAVAPYSLTLLRLNVN
jgi:alpha-L-arabinofuranosidase